ncbi:tRNA pseudouridine(38-40) synthase TruA [uncultured Eubacterium sp.]|uniref:tRNA pseudouridine(38-40) synthase TruA n=1 Tax=uncultured Eubacterium sp. TaxID=165185 RepID=UPI002591E20D|nr:tRNA pseudouridine(38-40) synthase TruA [uncultured Eubacterium sp.]
MRILLVVSYDGTNYCGWQKQNNCITIQGEVEKAISEVLKEDVEIIGASRTDSGVHANGNLAIFDTDSSIPADRWSKVLNQILPDDIVIQESKKVTDEFNPRYMKFSKTYEYKILNRSYPLPTYNKSAYYVYGNLNVDAMKLAANALVGEHDFVAFAGAGSQVKTTVRTIFSIDIIEEKLDPTTLGDSDDLLKTGRLIKIRVRGDGFLYNMVRIIAGTLVDVGMGRIKPEDIKGIIESKDRTKAGKTAPAHGLTLLEIEI